MAGKRIVAGGHRHPARPQLTVPAALNSDSDSEVMHGTTAVLNMLPFLAIMGTTFDGFLAGPMVACHAWRCWALRFIANT